MRPEAETANPLSERLLAWAGLARSLLGSVGSSGSSPRVLSQRTSGLANTPAKVGWHGG